jgi:erythronate-4-phosphate dehydrogenase
MRIIVDDDIPFIKGVLEPYFDVGYVSGGEISREIVRDVSGLVVRTRTVCNEYLLEGSRVEAIFSATIGSDHIDVDYCKNRGIGVYTAPGCNAYGVVQYVLTSLLALMNQNGDSLKGKNFGVIGAGNVGERLAEVLESWDFRVLRCDPPKSLEDNSKSYYELETIIKECDIISVHVPLDDSTRDMVSVDFFENIKSGLYFVNSSRGGVINEEALMRYRGKLKGLILDVWRNEPKINSVLLSETDVATPHIAGYSLEGKRNATVMSVNALGDYFGINDLSVFSVDLPDVSIPDLSLVEGGVEGATKALLEFFPVWDCVRNLKSYPDSFERMRSDYKLRREPPLSFYHRLKHLLHSSK